MFGESLKFSWSSIYGLLHNYFTNNLHRLDQVFLADYRGKLMHDFLPTNEKYYKSFNINGVSPLLDDRIIELSCKITPELKYDRLTNIGKKPLGEILQRVLQNHTIKYNKLGFGTDLNDLWLRSGREMVISTLDNGRIFEDKLISKEWFTKSIKRIKENGDIRYISKMLHLLSLEIWYRLYVTKEVWV